MNNPMNRKLFKPRTARNKLNQMGGIMASDAELMQTVARYNMGGPVGFNLGGSTELDNLRLDQRQLRLPQNQAFIEAMDNRVSGQNPRSVNLPRVTGISNVLKAAPRAALPAVVLAELADTALNTSVDREGIMATTPKFAGAEGQNRRPGITREQFDAMSPEDQQGYFQTEQDRLGAISGSISGAISGEGPLGIGGIAEELAIIPDMAQNLYEGIAGSDTVQRALKAAGILDPTSQFEKTRPRDFEERAVRTRAMNRPFESIEEFRASLPSAEGPLPAGRVVEPTAEYLQQLEQATGLPPGSIRLPSATDASGDPSEEAAVDFSGVVPDMPDVMPESEAEARDNARRAAEAAAATEAAGGQRPIPTEDETDYLEKYVPENLDEGDTLEMGLTEKERVIAAVNSNDKDFQQGELKRLMAEFTENAPQYEGMSRGLAIAKIGFAMAAGKSPNAISNIASALEQGADMFIKDKKDRDAFNRQVSLSALQYGLGEISKEKAQARTDARTFREVVPTKDGSFTLQNGDVVKYKEGETVSVPMTEIVANNGRLPEGLSGQNVEVYLKNEAAALEKQKAVNAALVKAREELIIDDKRQSELQKEYAGYVDQFIQAEVGTKFMTEALLELDQNGQYIMGLSGSGATLLNRVSNSLGVDLGAKFESKDQLEKKVRLGFQSLIKSYFTGSQSANSISNFDVTSLADAYIDGAFIQNADGTLSLATKDPDVIFDSLQNVLQQFQRDQQSSLSKMNGIEDRLVTRILPGMGTPSKPFSSGTAASLISRQQTRLDPYLGTEKARSQRSPFAVRVEAKETDGGRLRYRLSQG